MSNKSHKRKNAQPHSRVKRVQDLPFYRRLAIKWGLISIGGAGIIGGGIAYHYLHSPTDAVPASSALLTAPNEPISQDQIDKLYDELFSKVETAKKEAESSGKKLIILGGELHNCRNSLLLEFMLGDIANRLGIKEGLIETDSALLSNLTLQASETLKTRDETFNNQMGSIPDSADKRFAKYELILSGLKGLSHSPVFSLDTDKIPNPANTYLAMIEGMDLGCHYHPFDPDYAMRLKFVTSGDELKAFSKASEDKMVDAIAGVANQNHCVGFCGAAHAANLCQNLTDKGYKVLGINCAAGIHLENDEHMEPELRERMKRLYDLYTPELSTSYQLSPSDSFAMTLKASLRSQYNSGKITEEQYSLRTRLVDRIAGTQSKPDQGMSP